VWGRVREGGQRESCAGDALGFATSRLVTVFESMSWRSLRKSFQHRLAPAGLVIEAAANLRARSLPAAP